VDTADSFLIQLLTGLATVHKLIDLVLIITVVGLAGYGLRWFVIGAIEIYSRWQAARFDADRRWQLARRDDAERRTKLLVWRDLGHQRIEGNRLKLRAGIGFVPGDFDIEIEEVFTKNSL